MKSSAPQDAPAATSTTPAKSIIQQAQSPTRAPPSDEALASGKASLQQPAAAAVIHGLSADKLSGKRHLRKSRSWLRISEIQTSFRLVFLRASFCCADLHLGFPRAKRFGGAIPESLLCSATRTVGLPTYLGTRHGSITQTNSCETA